jgi:hypothetical protein
LVSRDWKNRCTKKCHQVCQESSSGAENTTKMHNKTSPGPNSDPKICGFPLQPARLNVRVSLPGHRTRTIVGKPPLLRGGPRQDQCQALALPIQHPRLQRRRMACDAFTRASRRLLECSAAPTMGPLQGEGEGGKSRKVRASRTPDSIPDSDSARKALQKSSLGSIFGPQAGVVGPLRGAFRE